MNKDDDNKRVVRVLLIRHARTTHNALGIIQGQLDTEINEDGEEEIKSLRANLVRMMTSKSSINRVKNGPKNIRKVVTSDLQRCLHTAQGMMIDASQMIEESSKLRERHVGVLQGCPRKTAPMEFPRAWATFCESKTKRGLRCAGEGGESVDDVLRRVRECIEDAVRSVLEEEEEEESNGDATIAVVTHAGVLLLLREYLVDEDLSGEKNRGIVRNCSIGTMRVEVGTSSDDSKSNTRWILDSWGKVDAEGTADVL